MVYQSITHHSIAKVASSLLETSVESLASHSLAASSAGHVLAVDKILGIVVVMVTILMRLLLSRGMSTLLLQHLLASSLLPFVLKQFTRTCRNFKSFNKRLNFNHKSNSRKENVQLSVYLSISHKNPCHIIITMSHHAYWPSYNLYIKIYLCCINDNIYWTIKCQEHMVESCETINPCRPFLDISMFVHLKHFMIIKLLLLNCKINVEWFFWIDVA